MVRRKEPCLGALKHPERIVGDSPVVHLPQPEKQADTSIQSVKANYWYNLSSGHAIVSLIFGSIIY